MGKTEKKAIVEKAVSMLANDEWDKFQNLYTVDENSLIEHLVNYLFWADNTKSSNKVSINGDIIKTRLPLLIASIIKLFTILVR